MTMAFKEMLAQVIAWLQQDQRVSYGALKRQFALDEAALADLQEAILYTYPHVQDDAGRGLVWTHAAPASAVEVPARLDAVLAAVTALLRCEGRVTYRMLTLACGLDEALLEAVRRELAFKQLAYEVHGEGLVWAGEMPSAALATRQPAAPAATIVATHAVPSPQSLAPEAYTSYTAATTVSDDIPTGVVEDTVPETLHGRSAIAIEPARSASIAERRQLTVLFCDLVGSTQLSGQLDPEDLRAVVRAYQAAAAEVIQRYEGHIAQYLGDGLLVYFGYPTAHEDDARRAVHTGLGIVEAMATLNTCLMAQYNVPLAVRLGIHTGPVVVGQMGGGGRHEHLALGETPNLAARLQGLAPANAVVISAVTARLVQGAFALEALGVHALQGIPEPLMVHRVRGLLALLGHDEEFVAAVVPVLVGREEESGLLRRRWAQSKAGLGQVVFISGEAGIGKSALVDVLRAQVRTEGLLRIAYRCSPYHTTSALSPVITHLEHLLQFAPDDAPATRLAKLEAGLRPSGLLLAEVVPLLAGLLSIPLPAERYAALTLSPQQQKQQTLDTLVAWLAAEAERQPVLVAWEDLHWADPTTLEMLGLVIEQAPTVPMLHVLTARPEFSPSWPHRSHITPLVLNRLERPQVEALMMQRAGGKPLPAEVVEYIVAKTDGVPLYVEELTKMLLASPLLREEADRYVLTGPLHTVAIPDTLQAALMARLDQLNRAKEVAQLGAVLGREFAYEVLQAIAPQDEATLQGGLAQLVAAELLYQRGRPPRARYIFKHALIQDAAYQSMLKSTRQQVHQRIAQMFEGRFPETVEAQPELVAQHYTAAGCTEPAVRYWQQAGQRAFQHSGNQEARRHLTTALEMLAMLPDTPARAQQELDLQMLLGPALMATMGFGAPEVERVYSRARWLCQQVGDTPQLFSVWRGLWQFSILRAELRTAYELAQQLFSLAKRLHDPTLLPEVHRTLGEPLAWLGEFALARTHLEQGVACYASQEYRIPYAVGLNPGVTCHIFAALALWPLGYVDQAQHNVQVALAAAQELPNPISLALTLCFAALFHQYRGEAAASYTRAEAAVRLSTERGFAHFVALGTIYQGWALVMQDQAAEGIAQIHDGLTAYEAASALLERPSSLALLAVAYGMVGKVEAGLQRLEEALALVEAREIRWCEAELHRCKGELLLRQTVPDALQAEACFQQALDVARRQEAKSWELRAAINLGRLWQQQGKHQEAYDLLAPIYGWFSEGLDTADLQEARVMLGELGH
jgi:class 3 adenylate cyclase/predicted ATPase